MMILTKKNNNKDLFKVTVFVILLHTVLIIWMAFTGTLISKNLEKPRFVVKTVQLEPKVSTIADSQKTPHFKDILEESLKEIVEISPKMENPVLINSQKQEILQKIEPSLPQVPVEATPLVVPTPKIVSKAKPQPEKVQPAKKEEKIVKKVEPKKTPITQKKVEPQKKEVPKIAKKEAVAPKTTTQPKVTLKNTIDPLVKQAEIKAKKEALEKEQKLIASLQNSMAKLEKGHSEINVVKSNLSKTAAVKSAISDLQIDLLSEPNATSLTSGEKHYRDELSNRLKLMLKLPTHGEVQVKLTLDRLGNVFKISIIKSQSQTNTNYIEKNLPLLKFPNFGNHFKDVPQYTFIIHLSNEL